jgi:hypothetical protein
LVGGEEVGEGEGCVGEDEDEVLGLGVAEGFEEGDDVEGVGGAEGGEDLGFALRTVRLDVVRFDDHLESASLGTVDFGCDAAGDVMAVLVIAYGDSRR